MPRGQAKRSPIVTRAQVGSGGEAAPPSEQPRAAIERTVARFAHAWYHGDAPGMLRCLHPDYLHRLVSIDGRGEPPGALVRSAVGVQGHFGSLVPVERHRQDVSILDVRHNSASAVAILGDWVLQVHLARAGGQWGIVNAMWEMG